MFLPCIHTAPCLYHQSLRGTTENVLITLLFVIFAIHTACFSLHY
ncbi:hypothetical protein VP468E531_P0058 [Vibrio phage 468E53-1]|nr:hypothetical protein VP468E531_P0058 [Vibrio phage 468E53-1]CAH9016011.1 hypothetical protein VP177E371_P0057 [Vibrio phage 177E37-1]